MFAEECEIVPARALVVLYRLVRLAKSVFSNQVGGVNLKPEIYYTDQHKNWSIQILKQK